jgi:hypothetical protein
MRKLTYPQPQRRLVARGDVAAGQSRVQEGPGATESGPTGWMVQLTLTPEARERAISSWWGNMLQGGLDHDIEDSVGRLYRAFRKVLERLPDEQLHNFWLFSPQLICLRSRGKIVRTSRDAVIYLAPSVLRMNDDNLAAVIAHEVAHLLLIHHDPDDQRFDQRHDDPIEAEKAADDLAEQWGFKRSYSPHDLYELGVPLARKSRLSQKARSRKSESTKPPSA